MDNILQYINDFQEILNKLSAMKFVLKLLVLLNSLPDSCEPLVLSLNNSALNAVMTISMAKENMHNEEVRRKFILFLLT